MKRSIFMLLLCLVFNKVLPLNQGKLDSLFLDSIQTELNLAKTDIARIQIYRNSFARIYANDLEAALEFTRQSLALSEKAQNLEGLYFSHRNLGLCYKTEGDIERSFAHFEQALLSAQKLKDSASVAACHTNVGTLYKMLGNYDRALEMQLKALTVFKSIKKKDVNDEIGSTCINIGNIYRRLGEYDKSLSYHHQSLEIHRAINKKSGIASNLTCIGNVHYYLGDYPKGVPYLEEAIEISREIGNLTSLLYGYISLGASYMGLEDYEKAEDNFLRSLKLIKEIGTGSPIKTSAYLNMAGLNIELRSFEVAENYIDSAKALAFDMNSKAYIQNVYETYYTLFTKMDDHKSALKNYKLFVEYKDSLFNEAKLDQIAEMQAKYDAEEKAQENKVLTRENKIKELQLHNKNYLIYGLGGGICFIIIIALLLLRQNQLKAKQKAIELEQRALRAQMNPHFIFNSLNSIQKFFMESNHEKANEYLGDFGELMRRILENSSRQQISIAEEISALRLYLSLEQARLDDQLSFEITIDEGIDEHHTLIPPLVIQPYVENAIWHGIVPKKEPGKVMVSVSTNRNFLICTVEDDGIGIEKSMRLKESENEQHEPIGMKVTAERVAKVETEALAQGTRITMHIPIT